VIQYADLQWDGTIEIIVDDLVANRVKIVNPSGNTVYTLPAAYTQYGAGRSAGDPICFEAIIEELDGTTFPEMVAIHKGCASSPSANTVVGLIEWTGAAYSEKWRLTIPKNQALEVIPVRFVPGLGHLLMDTVSGATQAAFQVRRPADGAVVYDWNVEHPGVNVISRDLVDLDSDGLQEIVVMTNEVVDAIPLYHLYLVKWNGVVEAPGEGVISSRLMLGQNAPNPFSSNTVIVFEAPRRERAVVRVFDPAGRLVRTLLDGTVEAGPRKLTWDGRDNGGRQAASGTYFYEVAVGGERQTRKMIRLQ
jgi:hypothetical protein